MELAFFFSLCVWSDESTEIIGNFFVLLTVCLFSFDLHVLMHTESELIEKPPYSPLEQLGIASINQRTSTQQLKLQGHILQQYAIFCLTRHNTGCLLRRASCPITPRPMLLLANPLLIPTRPVL
jgi:hypothetical protein